MRGATTPLQFWDEFAFIKYNKIMLGASTPATSQAMIEAKKKGRPYGKLITTTPNNIDIDIGAYCKKMIDEATPFEETFYDWKPKEIQAYVEQNKLNDFVYIEFSYKQLGRDQEWFETQKKALQNDTLLIKREILLEWTKSSDNSVYDEDTLDTIYESIQEPISYVMLQDMYRFNIYSDKLDLRKPYIISVDPGTGKSIDATAINVIDPITHEVMMDFRNNTINSVYLQNVLVELVLNYFPNSLVVIENNAMGTTILDFLLSTPIAKNLYYEYKTKRAETIEYAKKDIVFKKDTKKSKIYGVNTNNTSRNLMMEILDMEIFENPEIFGRINLYNDIKNLEYDRKGRIGHREGSHDDSLMSYLIGRYALAYGTNIGSFKRKIRSQMKMLNTYSEEEIKQYEELGVFNSMNNRNNQILNTINIANSSNINQIQQFDTMIDDYRDIYQENSKDSKTSSYENILNIVNDI